jgi:hypothetical protein
MRWKCEPRSFIWLFGKPGSGKTILSASVIKDVLQSSQGMGVVYYYFDFNDDAKKNAENMVRSIFHQLCQRSIVLPEGVRDLFAKCDEGKRVPSSIQLLDAIEQIIKELPGCFIIIDALDECDERAPVMKHLRRFHSSLDNLHILTTSRRLTDIELTLRSFLSWGQCIDLETSAVNEDIRLYIHDQLENNVDLQRWKNYSSIQTEIETSLMEKAHGMQVVSEMCHMEEDLS